MGSWRWRNVLQLLHSNDGLLFVFKDNYGGQEGTFPNTAPELMNS